MGGWLVVSVHDVCPRTRAATEAILAALSALGIRRRSLLVIPAEPGGELDAPTAHWLARRAAEGDEIVQHGWFHARRADEPPLRGSRAVLDALLARGAGEFLGLDADESARRLAAGRRVLADFGLRASGFVAPAWLYSSAAAEAVGRAGFRYYTTHLRLRDLATGRDHWSFGISNRPGRLADDLIGRGVNEGFGLLHAPLPLVRIAVHPADLAHHRPFAHTLSLLERLLAAGRRPLTYLDYLERRGS
jgi:predicted deacetylase